MCAGVAQWQRNWFVISGLQVQLLSPAPRKILRYTVKTTACIVGFLLLYALWNARKVRQKCDKSHKTASSATVCAPVLYALPYIIQLYNGLLYAPAMGWVCSVSRPTTSFLIRCRSPLLCLYCITVNGCNPLTNCTMLTVIFDTNYTLTVMWLTVII